MALRIDVAARLSLSSPEREKFRRLATAAMAPDPLLPEPATGRK